MREPPGSTERATWTRSLYWPVGIPLGTQWPSAADLVELAQPRALREEFVQPWEIEPLYLRKSDAEINWEKR